MEPDTLENQIALGKREMDRLHARVLHELARGMYRRAASSCNEAATVAAQLAQLREQSGRAHRGPFGVDVGAHRLVTLPGITCSADPDNFAWTISASPQKMTTLALERVLVDLRDALKRITRRPARKGRASK